MFRPLPAHIDEVRACNELSVRKDIDGITRASLSSVFAGEGRGFPRDGAGVLLDARALRHPAAGKRVVVVGRSLVIGRPAAAMFLNRDATVTVCHSRTENLPEAMCEADIVVCATAVPARLRRGSAFGRADGARRRHQLRRVGEHVRRRRLQGGRACGRGHHAGAARARLCDDERHHRACRARRRSLRFPQPALIPAPVSPHVLLVCCSRLPELLSAGGFVVSWAHG